MELDFAEMARAGLEIADLLEASEAENARLREALQRIVDYPEIYENGSVIHSGGWIFSTLKGIARTALTNAGRP